MSTISERGVGCVYLLRWPGKTSRMYVGVNETDDTGLSRLKEHLKEARRGSSYRVHCAIRKHGTPCVTVLFRSGVRALLYVVEEELVDEFGTYRNGYNMTPGGDGAALTPEGRAKHRAVVASPEYRAKVSAAASKPERRALSRAQMEAVNANPVSQERKAQFNILRAARHSAAIWMEWQDRWRDDPEWRAAVEDALASPDFARRAARSAAGRAAARATWDKPGFRERHAEGLRHHWDAYRAYEEG